MGKIMNALDAVGKAIEHSAELNRRIDKMTSELITRDRTLDLTEARKVARILVTQAEVTWK